MTDSASVRELRDAGLLHKRLLVRVRMLLAISLLLLTVVLYQVIRYGIHLWICLGIAIIAFLLGLFIFSKMNKVVWNENEEIIQAGKMDLLGGAILILYVIFEISLRTYLKTEFAGSLAATSYLLSAIGASLLGRSIGTLIAIRKIGKDEGLAI